MSLKNLAKKVKKEQKERNLSIEELFNAEIDQYLVKPKENKQSRKAFHPSGFYKCIRYNYYKLKGETEVKKIYPRSQRILQVGTVLHEWIQTLIMEISQDSTSNLNIIPVEELPFYGAEGVEIIKNHHAHPIEVKFIDRRWTKEIPISAMIDGALEFMNIQTLFEFKTINSKDFEYLIEPLREHAIQGALYALCTGVRRVIFLYLNKDTQELKPYLVEYSDSQLEWVRQRLAIIEDCCINDELPEKEEGDGCKWCGYKVLCENNSKGAEKSA